MFTISFVNFIQVALLSISALGALLLWRQPPFRYVCLLLSLIVISQIFNLLEELNITRDIMLVTPIFILAFGPATYLAVNGVLGDKLTKMALLHFVPMLIALPFTQYPEVIIAIGTLWRLGYAILTLNRLYHFHREIVQQRSDAIELDLKWLSWLIVLMTIVSVFNLIRLNIQPFIPVFYNVFGQGVSTFISLVFITFLIVQLIEQKTAFIALSNNKNNKELAGKTIKTEDTAIENSDDKAHYKQLFEHLDEQIQANLWYKIPRLTLNRLSELSQLQSRDISRAINLTANLSFNDYINKLRLEDVVRALEKEPMVSLTQLSLDAGFNSKSTFNLAFKRVYQKTPQTFKNELLTKR